MTNPNQRHVVAICRNARRGTRAALIVQGGCLIDISFSSAVVILLLVMDPVGNVPLFVSILRDIEPARRNRIIMRECAIAFAVLLLFVVSGRFLLDLLGLSECRSISPAESYCS